MKQTLLYSLSLLLILSPSLSCSKNSRSKPACKLIAATAGDASSTETVNITYNDAGKTSTLEEISTSSTLTKVFTYSGNVVLVTSTTSGSPDVTTDSIVVNGDGLMISDLSRSGGNVNLTTYAYSGTEVTGSSSQEGTQTPVTTSYIFTNGDFMSGPGTVVTYNDKPSAPGDYIQFLQLIQYGAPFIKTAHQCTGYQNGNTLQNFNYAYDSSGKITKMVITTGTVVATYSYSYECN